MNDEQILEMGGDEEDIRKCAEEHGATNPMPPNTKKCCGDCGFAQLPPKTGIDCVQPKCPCHTPSLDKSEHDGTCRTPECYEKRPTPAVEDWEKEFDTQFDYSKKFGVMWYGKESENPLIEIKNFIRSLREADRKRIVDEIAKHNARILNHFQLQGTPEMPMIAYDERVCLVPAIEAATKETLTNLK